MSASAWKQSHGETVPNIEMAYSETEDKGLEDENLLPQTTSLQPTKRSRILSILPWALNFILAIGALWSWSRSPSASPTVLSCDSKVFSTEFQPATSAVTYKQVRFQSGIRHDINGTLYRTNPQPKSFVGKPHPDIDIAWFDLTKGLDMYVLPEEVNTIEGHLHQFQPSSLYQTEIEWLHNLHCLNYIRKSFDPEYYRLDLHHPQESHEAHRDHCIDALRQILQCHGDLTPMPKLWDEETGREYTDFERVHTCRDVNALREWATQRSFDAYERRLEFEKAEHS